MAIAARACLVGVLIVTAFATRLVVAAELADCQRMLLTGDYEKCIQATAEALSQNRYGEAWPMTKAQAELAIGRYADAVKTVNSGIERYSWSVRLRWLGIRAAHHAGDEVAAKKFFDEVADYSKRFSWRYTDSEEMVVLGQVDLLNGVDAKVVLAQRYEKAKLRNARCREVWLAIEELAREKQDRGLATDALREALKLFPEDADIHLGLAEVLDVSDRPASLKHLAAALAANPNHVPSLLYQVEQLVNAEAYEAAIELLAMVEKINPHEPDAWAYRAVIAHLKADTQGEQTFREKALATWKNNPRVEHLIGRLLSQHYRFAEGAACQRRALAIDPKYVPSLRQLAQDLLRLGDEDAGWKLAQEAHDADGYNVATFNLLELKDAIREFTTLEDDSFILRMEKVESQLYGREALALLHRAKQTLGEKFGLKLKHKITVEIFPNPDDFAVRTFGMPAVSGYLGVCFGKVITANSPASRREQPANWQAVLWHEFCHVVTLELTHNRIPRWLSEGISVYEESQAQATWGQHLDPRSREHILEDGLTPLGKLSGAFMRPKSGWHLNFAYFESALAVEFLIKTHGAAALRNVLTDLADGLPINTALERRCDSLENLEPAFETFCRQKADSFAPGVDWTKPDLATLQNADNDEFEVWVKEHPQNFIAALSWSDHLLKSRQWVEAETALKKTIALFPSYVGGDNAYEKLARVYRELKRPEDELATLSQFIRLEASSMTPRLRLIELQRAASNWSGLDQTATSILAIDPLQRAAHEASARAAEQLQRFDRAAQALERVLLLEPDDPADAHYRLARAYRHTGRHADAKRQVLEALEEAPRFRAAQELLLQLADEPKSSGK